MFSRRFWIRGIAAAVCLAAASQALAVEPQQGAASSRAKNYAFLVACADYDLKELKPLSYTVNDLLALNQTLLESGFERDNIVLMHDTQSRDYLPEVRKIREQFDLLLSRVGRNDTLVVALAGHGVQFKGDQRNFFCPLDARLTDRKTLIALDEIYRQLQACRAQRKMLLVDACRNDPQSNLGRSRAEVDLESITRPQSEAVPDGIVALFSCSAGQQSFEHPDLKHGIFFHHVLEGWRGAADMNRDRRLTMSELAEYAKEKTQTFAHLKLGAKQIPQQKGEFSGIWVLRDLLPEQAVALTPAGEWKISLGRMPDGSAYSGPVSIQALGNVYFMTWGTTGYTGLGFLQDGHLFVGTSMGRSYGMVLYKIERDGTLRGRWTMLSDNGRVGTEVAVGGQTGKLGGQYQVTGTRTQDGLAYQGAMAMSQQGDVYHLAWRVKDDVFRGIGLRFGDWLAVAWGPEGESVAVVDYSLSNNAALGRWSFLGQATLGVENLVRAQ